MEAVARTDVTRTQPTLRFGDVAVYLGFVTRTQVEAAVALQRDEENKGEPHRLLGEVLRAKGWLTYAQCCQVADTLVELARQRREASPMEWTL